MTFIQPIHLWITFYHMIGYVLSYYDGLHFIIGYVMFYHMIGYVLSYYDGLHFIIGYVTFLSYDRLRFIIL